MSDATISAGYAKALLDFAADRRADRAALLARSRIDPADLEGPDNRVRLDRYLKMLEAAADLCNEPALALQFGESIRFEDISIVGLIASAAKTIGEGRTQMNRYARLVVDDDDAKVANMLDLLRQDGEVWLQLTGSIYAEARQLTEAAFARVVCGARANLAHTPYFRSRCFPKAVHFTHTEPAYRAEYDRIFNVPLVFGSDRNALMIDEEFLSIELPPANRYVFGVLSERAEALLKRLESSTTSRGRAEAALLPILHTGTASMELIASKLGLSRQSLYRRLKTEGVSFERLLDELRHKMALHYLHGKKVSVNETAYLVGFSDPASFSRAFKRWTGFAPTMRGGKATRAKTGREP